uniref:Uncharacterized protein n=1 Tax=Arundo donax TaxID=35708 RepID=A0A0A9G3H7_ARUDO
MGSPRVGRAVASREERAVAPGEEQAVAPPAENGGTDLGSPGEERAAAPPAMEAEKSPLRLAAAAACECAAPRRLAAACE